MTERPVREKNTAVIRVYIDLEQREDKGQVERNSTEAKKQKVLVKTNEKEKALRGTKEITREKK